jgi:hypothetical protein
MKTRLFRFMVLSSLLLALVALLAPLAIAGDDESEKVKIELKAPLEAVDCLAVPATLTVLGLNIDISKAKIESDNDGDYHVNHSEHADGTCADLIPGQRVEVKLAGDTPDPITGLLSAVKVEAEDECEGDDDHDSVKVEAPLQAVDTVANTVTVLGLVIDISQAELEGDDDDEDKYEDKHHLARHSYNDDEDDCDEAPLDISQLIVGQFVEIKLVSAQAPLAATKLEVKNFDNEVEIEIDDNDDVDIDVSVVTLVKARKKTVKKVLTFHTAGNGSVKLNGLPTGKAKIVARSVQDGRVGKSAVKVKKNSSKLVRVRLKPAR